MQNIYEPLLWYNGANGTSTIPWLAQNYTISPNGTEAFFTLRSGITFQDGEPLNSTAVYFSLNRLLINDGSTPSTHGTEAAWILQQVENFSLSTAFTGPHAYNQAWLNKVLAENVVQITGPLTFTIHVESPDASLPFLLAGQWAEIVAPDFVMQHDLALWNQSSMGYTLPYPSIGGGNETALVNEYFADQVATCNSGATPTGCGTTYLDGSYNGASAGTGPYSVVSVGKSSNDIVLSANSNYWGGAYQYMRGAKVTPQIKTIDIKYIAQISTREVDLQNAAHSGQAMAIDLPNDNLYDVADRNAWLTNGSLESIIPGVTISGPYTNYNVFETPFGMNVTNPLTGTFYKFQPFADLRIRLAFADSVNMTDINEQENNNMGVVANSPFGPGFPPAGTYNSSITTRYAFNLTAVQDFLLSAMEQPLTHFNFENGTSAPAGLFNNTFGCPTLGSSGTCSSPVAQTIPLYYNAGDTVSEAILTEMASAINNVSSTYNMGLTATVVPIPEGQLTTYAISGEVFTWPSTITNDYPWVMDFLGPFYAPYDILPGPQGWNLQVMGTLFSQASTANSVRNVTGLVKVTNMMNAIANQQVMYFWEYYPRVFQVMTSNVQGYYYNPALVGTIEYFATLY